jgi:acyl carrier protein phosphodiesterase
VNFFAHLVVARRRRRDPAFLFGAMLPDFATMCGARLGPIEGGALADGVAEHHHTDDAFHGGATFLALCRETAARLEARGLGWGASRAVAHVGTEIFLDGELTRDEDAASDYIAAIAHAAEDALRARIVFRDEGGHARFRRMHERLASHGTPTRYREPLFVRDVLVRILAERPRLAVAPEHAGTLLTELEQLAEQVRAAQGALVGETLAALGRESAQASQR